MRRAEAESFRGKRLRSTTRVVEKDPTLALLRHVGAWLRHGETAVRVMVHVNVQGLPFNKQNGRHEEKLIFITALFDPQGKFLTGAEGVMDFALRDASLFEVFSQGVTAKLSLLAPPGNYRLRQVVQEVANGKITSMSRAVEIH